MFTLVSLYVSICAGILQRLLLNKTMDVSSWNAWQVQVQVQEQQEKEQIQVKNKKNKKKKKKKKKYKNKNKYKNPPVCTRQLQ